MASFDFGENWNGVRSKLHVLDDSIVIQDHMDAQPILDQNARMRNQARRMRNGYHAASIPVTIYYEWRKEWMREHRQHWTWKTYLASKLNSREWMKLRTTEARI